MESKDSTLMEMMTQLMARMERLEENSKLRKIIQHGDLQNRRQNHGWWYVIDVARKVILHGTVLSLRDLQIRETKVSWGDCPDPKGNFKGINYIYINC